MELLCQQAIASNKPEKSTNAFPTPVIPQARPTMPQMQPEPRPEKQLDQSHRYNYQPPTPTPPQQLPQTGAGMVDGLSQDEERRAVEYVKANFEGREEQRQALDGLLQQLLSRKQERQETQEKQDFISEGAFAGTLARTSPQEDRGVIGEGFITRQEASKIEEGSSMRENTKKTLSNLVPSTINVADDIETMILNPIDTLGGLGKLMVGGLLEGGQAINELVTGDDSSETYKQVYEDMKSKGGLVGRLGETLESSDETAGMVGQVLTDRYGSTEAFQETLVEDPVGVLSDVAGIVSGGASLAGKSATALSRAGVQTSRLSKVARTTDKVQRFADKVDPYTVAFTKLGEGATETGRLVKERSKPALEKVTKAFGDQEQILQNMNRIKKGKQEEFKAKIGQTPGEWLNERGIISGPNETVESLAQRFKNSYQSVDEGLNQIQGTYKNKDLDWIVEDVVRFAENTADDRLPRMQELQAKNATDGLTMTEVNEVKRYFERNNKFTYGRENTASGAEKTKRATNYDNRLRKRQMEIAEQNGFDNLREMNKETQASKLLLDELVKNESGRLGNNAMSLTDWIVVGADPTGAGLGTLVAKRFFGSSAVRSKYVEFLNYIDGLDTMSEKVANLKAIQDAQSEKEVLRIMEDVKRQVEQKALPAPEAQAVTPEGVVQGTPLPPEPTTIQPRQVLEL